jgi:hypothetical protein
MGVVLVNDSLERRLRKLLTEQKNSYLGQSKSINMKKLILATFLFIATTLSAQDKKRNFKTQIVETACGQCQFDMEGFWLIWLFASMASPILWMEHR